MKLYLNWNDLGGSCSLKTIISIHILRRCIRVTRQEGKHSVERAPYRFLKRLLKNGKRGMISRKQTAKHADGGGATCKKFLRNCPRIVAAIWSFVRGCFDVCLSSDSRREGQLDDNGQRKLPEEIHLGEPTGKGYSLRPISWHFQSLSCLESAL